MENITILYPVKVKECAIKYNIKDDNISNEMLDVFKFYCKDGCKDGVDNDDNMNVEIFKYNKKDIESFFNDSFNLIFENDIEKIEFENFCKRKRNINNEVLIFDEKEIENKFQILQKVFKILSENLKDVTEYFNKIKYEKVLEKNNIFSWIEENGSEALKLSVKYKYNAFDRYEKELIKKRFGEEFEVYTHYRHYFDYYIKRDRIKNPTLEQLKEIEDCIRIFGNNDNICYSNYENDNKIYIFLDDLDVVICKCSNA